MGCTKLTDKDSSQALENNDLYYFLGIDNTPYRFNGKEIDPETGNQYYGARYYDPKISVWLSVDPLFSRDPNLTPYHFVKNNPIAFVDPKGLTSYKVGRDGNVEKVDDQRYIRNKHGEVSSVHPDYETKEGEEIVNEFTGTNAGGKEQVKYLQIAKRSPRKMNANNIRKGKIEERKLDWYYSGSHKDAMSFIEFVHEVTDKEFSYKHSKTEDKEYFDIGSLRKGGESSSIQCGKTLLYDLHNHPGGTRPSKEDAHGALKSPGAHFEVYSHSGYTRYWPQSMQDTSPLSIGRSHIKSSYNYVK